MKMKRFNVLYSVTTSQEADVLAVNKEKAIAKVVEVIGEPVEIEMVYELPTKVPTNERD